MPKNNETQFFKIKFKGYVSENQDCIKKTLNKHLVLNRKVSNLDIKEIIHIFTTFCTRL